MKDKRRNAMRTNMVEKGDKLFIRDKDGTNLFEVRKLESGGWVFKTEYQTALVEIDRLEDCWINRNGTQELIVEYYDEKKKKDTSVKFLKYVPDKEQEKTGKKMDHRTDKEKKKKPAPKNRNKNKR